MIRAFSFLLSTVLLWSSCSAKKYEAPDNLISEDKMVEIISEFMIINAAKGVNKIILEEHITDPTAYVFEKYKIDSLQFQQSNAYYARNIESYTLIYNQVNQYLESKKTAFQDKIDARNRELDSLKQLKLNKKDTIPELKKNDLVPKTSRFRNQPKKFDTLRSMIQK